MTHATTPIDDKPLRDRWRAWPWLLSLVLNGILAVILAFFATSSFLFDRTVEDERTRQIKENEKVLIARLEAKRERAALSQQQADHLEQEILAKREAEAREIVRTLVLQRQEALAERQEAFDRLKLRTPEKHIEAAVRNLIPELDALPKRVEPFLADPEVPEDQKRRVRDALDKIAATSESLKAADPATARGLVERLHKETFPISDVGYRFPERTPAASGATKAKAKTLHEVGSAISAHARHTSERVLAKDPAQVNDTDSALGDSTTPDGFAGDAAPDLSTMDLSDLYALGVGIERHLQALNDDARAADTSVIQNDAYTPVREGVGGPVRAGGAPERPALGELAPGGVETVADLAHTRTAADEALRQLHSIASRAGVNPATSQALAVVEAQTSGHGNTPLALGTNGYSDVTALNWGGSRTGTSDMMWRPTRQELEAKLPGDLVYANALPGRRVTDVSLRSGWLYIDTWYIIGPWRNRNDLSMTQVLPPEHGIDLDATYNDANTYGPLRWQFVQSNEAMIVPPNVRDAGSYFCYTEIYSDRDRDVLLAIAADDAAKFWLNGTKIYEMKGASVYALGEALRKVHLHPGTNTLVGRIENGPIYCLWSVLLCPPEAIDVN